MTNHTPDFTSPLAGRIEVRQPCPWCGDRQMIPRIQFDEHVMRLHPDVTTSERRAVLAGEPAEPAPADQATAGPAREYLTAVVSRAVYEYREQACQWDESDGTTEEIARRVVNALLRDRQEQPAPAHKWTFEACYDASNDKWHGVGGTYYDHSEATTAFKRRAERDSDHEHSKFRLVHETTTYTVEAEHPAARPDGHADTPPAKEQR